MTVEPDLAGLVTSLDTFVAERNWAQFHSAKNLVMALTAEVGELTEHFMWRTPEQSDHLPPDTAAAVADELADVFIYLLHLSRRLDVDLVAAAHRKLRAAQLKYPAERTRVPEPADD
jgi:NTP pyrophosphatase (non-canonical NTP hydrolase)